MELEAMNPPSLPTNLVESVLCTAIRLCRPNRLHDTQRVITLINVLPASTVPASARTAVMVMPWIDTDMASRMGSKWLLDTLWAMSTNPTINRPLQYSLSSPPERRGLIAASAQGFIHVLDWWREHALPLVGSAPLAVCSASKAGHVDVLDWWWTNVGFVWFDFEGAHGIRCDAIDLACLQGRLAVIQWWFGKYDGDQVVTSNEALVFAVVSNHFDILEWWFEQGRLEALPEKQAKDVVVALVLVNRLDLVHKYFAIDRHGGTLGFALPYACYNGNLELIQSVLTFHQVDGNLNPTSGIPHNACALVNKALVARTFYMASAAGHVHVLDWLVNQGVRFESQAVRVNKLDWMVQRACPTLQFLPSLVCARTYIRDRDQVHFADIASANGHIPVLAWWAQRVHLEYSSHAFDEPSAVGNVAVLHWWEQAQAYYPRTDTNAIDLAATNGHVDVLDWWFSFPQFSLAIHYSAEALHGAAKKKTAT